VSIEYSESHYRTILRTARSVGYVTSGFVEPVEAERRLFLRHDVDISIDLAVKLAEINNDEGVAGTFAVLLRSQIYNLLSPFVLPQLQRLRELGQSLALHHAGTWSLSPDEVTQSVTSDFHIAKHAVPGIEPAYAWHNPTPELVESMLDHDAAGLVNMYGRRFTRDMQYLSDSNMRNSVETFEHALRDESQTDVHFLFHPLNWTVGGRSVLEAFGRAWPHIVREREAEILQNRIYRESLPNGLPSEALDALTAAVAQSIDGP
jgi:hypothetical protein